MLNKEKYAKELIESAITDNGFAICKHNNLPYECRRLDCNDCLFKGKEGVPCADTRYIWANSEYKEPKVFTEEEKQLIRLLDKVKYVARDRDGILCFYEDKPEKDDEEWDDLEDHCYVENLTSLSFNAIKWEDKEPTSREEILGE